MTGSGRGQVGDGFVEGKGILENYEGHDMFIVSGSGSGTGISVTGAAPVPASSGQREGEREREREGGRELVSYRRWPALPAIPRASGACMRVIRRPAAAAADGYGSGTMVNVGNGQARRARL